ncbi:MAG: BREX-1 system adenine-specific DNA-methyltransferase PglX, partial [Bilifractor sp.]
MNKTAIKNFSIWARNALMDQVRTQMRLLGITEERIAAPLPQSAGHTQFFDIGTDQPYQIDGKAVDQRAHLVDHLRAQEKEEEGGYASAYEHVVEEAAYTWFNRLIAVRFMEVNGYLPWHVRVLSSESTGKIEPDLVSEPFSADGDIEMTDEEKREILAMMEAQDADGLFSAMFLKACNALNKVLPKLFEKPADWTELLLNLSFVDRDGVVWHLVHDIPEEDFNVQQGGQVEIIGWLYQFYNTEPKDAAYAAKGKFTKAQIPAVTQLFTPDWIVRYMVANSLGRLWSEGHPESTLKDHWNYYLDEAEQTAEVQRQLDGIRGDYAQLRPEDLSCVDCAAGSGHILVALFELLMQIYESQGYTRRDAAVNILKYNLYGLDIDDRAAQIAYFSVMMKAREYNRRILDPEHIITPHVYAIPESNGINRGQLQLMGTELPEEDRNRALAQMNELLDAMTDAKVYGSIISVKPYDWDLLRRFIGEHGEPAQMKIKAIGIGDTERQLQKIVAVGELLSRKYWVAVTNPPYMGGSTMNAKLSDYVKKQYPDSKADLFAVFMECWNRHIVPTGFNCMVTMQSWMFLSSFEKMRENILENYTINNLMHMENMVLGIAFGTAVTNIRNRRLENYRGTYHQIKLEDIVDGIPTEFPAMKNRFAQTSQSNFSKIPGSPVAYWVAPQVYNVFERGESLGKLVPVKKGMDTSNNDVYLRLWSEVSFCSVGINYSCLEAFNKGGCKWAPYNKGGAFRRWYGNISWIIDWDKDGYDLRHSKANIRSEKYYCTNSITWSAVTAGGSSFRLSNYGALFDSAGSSMFPHDLLDYLLPLMNTKLVDSILGIINPTLNYGAGSVSKLPVIVTNDGDVLNEIKKRNEFCLKCSRADWDSFETSWDFQAHPFILCRKEHAEDEQYGLVENCYQAFKQTCEERFCRLKENEEELNRIFIDIYGLQEELTPEESGGDVTVARVYDEKKDIPEEMKRNKYVLTREDVMKSLISYAVGCMFGRYSLDEPGLAYAGGSWDPEKYRTFLPDEDNVIPITDEEYFRDDIVGRFCAWLKAAFGEQNLEQNLDYVASSLHVKGDSSREIIRNYFLKDFFKDHCKTYSVTGSGKRPIYWLFDSGKQNGFKALIYMHRYDKNTIGRLRVEYLHRIQRVYDAEITRMQDTAERSGNASERARASKRAEKLIRQQAECRKYDENISHLALSEIEIDLDDGVKVNYEKVQTAS